MEFYPGETAKSIAQRAKNPQNLEGKVRRQHFSPGWEDLNLPRESLASKKPQFLNKNHEQR
jgi:hypothetical protein